jgi:hypothetical protein
MEIGTSLSGYSENPFVEFNKRQTMLNKASSQINDPISFKIASNIFKTKFYLPPIPSQQNNESQNILLLLED